MLRRIFSINGLFLISVVVFLLWGGAVVVFAYGWLPNFVKGETITMLDFTGLSVDEARERASQLGAIINFEATVVRHDENTPKGHVISHTPGPRQIVKATRPLIFTVSDGPEVVVVPDLRRKTLREARFELSVAGLRVGDIAYSYSDEYPQADAIITTMPQPREDATRGTGVDLLISRGARPYRFTMPSIVGLTLDEAEAALRDIGLSLGRVIEKANPQRKRDEVLAQSPIAGEIVVSGSHVAVTANALPSQSLARLEVVRHRVTGDPAETKRVRIIIRDEAGRHTLHDADEPGGKLISVPRSVVGEATLIIYEDDLQTPVREEPLR